MGSNGLKAIADIFERHVFRIPDYQRGYSWTKKQLSDFWEDVENLSENHIHYTGVLTLEPVNESVFSNWEEDLWLIKGKGFTPHYIVDGQQRLTTAIILIQAIIEKLYEDEKLNYTSRKEIIEKYISQSKDGGISQTFIFGYEKDNPSYEFLKTKIFMASSSANQDIETLYTANLEYAKDYFKNKINELAFEDLEILFRKITQFLKFNVYEIEEDLDVFVAFETMNNRGKKLSNLELMKNRLIYLSTLFKVEQYEKNSLRTNINNAWKTIYEYLGKNKINPLDDDNFLKNHWIMYFKYSRKTASDYITFLLEEHFTSRRALDGEISMIEIQEYVTSMQNSVKVWYYIHNANDSSYDQDITKWLIKLRNLNFGAFAPLTMAILVNKESYKTEEITKVLKSMESYVFLIFRISRRSSNTGDSEFYRFARDIYLKSLSLKEITDVIEVWIFGDDESEGYYDIKKFIDYIKDHFDIQQDGYYGWNGLKYLLYEYDYSLQEDSKEEHKKIDWVEFNKEKTNFITIEHIYPQTSDNDCWNKSFGIFTDEQKLKLCNTLGNLVLLSQKKNSSLQNDCFADKKHQQNGKVGYFNGSYSENEVAQYSEWTSETIKERGLKILSFIEERWNIDLGTDEDKLKILQIEFLMEGTQ